MFIVTSKLCPKVCKLGITSHFHMFSFAYWGMDCIFDNGQYATYAAVKLITPNISLIWVYRHVESLFSTYSVNVLFSSRVTRRVIWSSSKVPLEPCGNVVLCNLNVIPQSVPPARCFLIHRVIMGNQSSHYSPSSRLCCREVFHHVLFFFF